MKASQQIVSISRIFPHAKVPSAGGWYVQQLFVALAKERQLSVLAPHGPENARGLEAGDWSGQLVGVDPSSRGRFARIVGRVMWILDPGFPDLALLQAVVLDNRTRALLASADVIDLQWAEIARLAPIIRRINPDARIVLTFHDVLSQRFRRRAEAASGAAALRWKWAAWLSDRAARRASRAADVCVVFSDKDQDLLPVGSPTEVVSPPLGTGADRNIAGQAGSRTVLFVGALSRVENEEAVLWFLESVWPAVLQGVPEAKFVIAGANPSSRLTAAAEGSLGGVTLTGFVDDLDDVYRQAGVIVIPLLRGAGLKFKAVEAMLSGTPTVCTSVGAEGIPERSLFWRVTDNASEFASAVVGALGDWEAAFAHAAVATKAADDRYSRERFEEHLRRIYSNAPLARDSE